MRIFNLIITTKKKQDAFIAAYNETIKNFHRKRSWACVRWVIYSLKELRKNTWDKERVDNTINWLRGEFEVEE